MITHSNQVCFVKMIGRRLQEEVFGRELGRKASRTYLTNLTTPLGRPPSVKGLRPDFTTKTDSAVHLPQKRHALGVEDFR